MKKTIILSLMMMFFSVSFLSAAEKHSYKPENGYVPDQETAVKIAEAVLTTIYSEKTIADEKPLKAELKDDVWIVAGTLPCPEGQRCLGGVAVIEISKDDGKILRVSHGK